VSNTTAPGGARGAPQSQPGLVELGRPGDVAHLQGDEGRSGHGHDGLLVSCVSTLTQDLACQNIDMSQGEAVGPVDQAVGYVLKQAATALRAAMDTVLRPLELTVPQYSCLEVLDQRPGLSSSELARATFVTRQSMNRSCRAWRIAGCSPGPPPPPTARRCPPSSPPPAASGCVRPASRSAPSRSRCSPRSPRAPNSGSVPTSPPAPPASRGTLRGLGAGEVTSNHLRG